jgi:hypothetical protein
VQAAWPGECTGDAAAARSKVATRASSSVSPSNSCSKQAASTTLSAEAAEDASRKFEPSLVLSGADPTVFPDGSASIQRCLSRPSGGWARVGQVKSAGLGQDPAGPSWQH